MASWLLSFLLRNPEDGERDPLMVREGSSGQGSWRDPTAIDEKDNIERDAGEKEASLSSASINNGTNGDDPIPYTPADEEITVVRSTTSMYTSRVRCIKKLLF